MIKQNSKHFNRSLFFGSSSFRLSFLENVCHPDLVDDYVRLFLSSCVCYGMSTKKNTEYHLHKKREKRGKAAFFKDTSSYFSLLNLKSLIERFGSLRNLWEKERKKIIKYIKAVMNAICDTETYMPCVLNSLLCMHCLKNFMEDNQHYQEPKMSKMRDFKLYKSHDAFNEDFSTGKILVSVIVKLQRVKFNDEKGCSRFNLYHAPLLFSNKKQNSEVFFCEKLG